jgi:hypothetical protein
MAMEAELDTQIRAICKTLEAVSSSFSEDLKKRDAIKIAAFAYVFAMTRHRRQFEDYMANLSKPLTAEQEDYLKKILR